MSTSIRIPDVVMAYVRRVAKAHAISLTEAATMLIMREAKGK